MKELCRSRDHQKVPCPVVDIERRKEGRLDPKEQEGQKTDKDKGSGWSSAGPEGWQCPSGKFYNFSHRTVCLQCKAPR
eukprot:4424077-Amphidinium_carterae.1